MKRKTYTYDCMSRKENPIKIVVWCRNAFGERGVGWDFHYSRGKVIVEIWDEKLDTMWVMWKE